jgi:hypothetical protein
MGDQVEGSAPVSTPVGSRPDRAGLSPSVEEAASGAGPHHKSPQLELVLRHAEHLLNYAVEAGIELDADIAQRIIAAKRLGPAIWDGPDAGALIAAITKLAAKLQPVTAETLRACREDAPGAIRGYKRVVYALAAIIIPLSIYSFVCTAISNSITADLSTANNLVTTLHTQLDSTTTIPPEQIAPPGSLSETQQFAALMRAIYSRTQQLNWLVPYKRWDPFRSSSGAPRPDAKTESASAPAPADAKTEPAPAASTPALADCPPATPDRAMGPYAKMQLPPNLRNLTAKLQPAVDCLTKVYQDVRLYATNIQDDTSIVLGALSACILPVLYALLGACAYVLRTFTEQTDKRTFAPSYATPARFIIAAIGGEVVGLFSNFGQGASLSPLALAFLVGYATDIFFSFLEGSIPKVGGGKT